jgi:hypothetical protein
MNLLIDRGGRRHQRGAVDLSSAIWRRGFIHIREGKRGIIVSLSPSLVKGPTLAAAVYAIADINPKHTSLIIEKSSCTAIVFYTDWKAACRRICELAATSRCIEKAQTAPLCSNAEFSTETEVLDDPEHIIDTTLKCHVQGNPESLTREILERLWEAGYDIRPSRY